VLCKRNQYLNAVLARVSCKEQHFRTEIWKGKHRTCQQGGPPGRRGVGWVVVRLVGLQGTRDQGSADIESSYQEVTINRTSAERM
jgi:hypothetical protein